MEEDRDIFKDINKIVANANGSTPSSFRTQEISQAVLDYFGVHKIPSEKSDFERMIMSKMAIQSHGTQLSKKQELLEEKDRIISELNIDNKRLKHELNMGLSKQDRKDIKKLESNTKLREDIKGLKKLRDDLLYKLHRSHTISQS